MGKIINLKLENILLITGISLYAFIAPWDDLPKFKTSSFSVRLGFLGLLSLNLYLIAFERKKIIKLIFENKLIVFLIFSFSLFILFQYIFISDSLKTPFSLFWLVSNWVFFYCSTQISSSKKIVLYSILTSSLLSSLLIITQHFFYPFFLTPTNAENLYLAPDFFRAYAYLGEPSYVSLLLFPSLIFFLSDRKENFLGTFSIFTTALALCLTYSRLSYIAILVSLLCLFFVFRYSPKVKLKRSFNIIAALIIGIYQCPFFFNIDSPLPFTAPVRASEFYSFKNKEVPVMQTSSSQRFDALKNGYGAFKGNILFGVGLGNSLNYIQANSSQESNKRIEGPHNLTLELLCELGVIGFSLLIMILSLFTKNLSLGHLNKIFLLFFGLELLLMQAVQNINMPSMWIAFVLFYITFCPKNSS